MKNVILNEKNQINFFDDIIKQLKENINNKEKNNEKVHLYFKPLYNKENKIYNELLIHCFYKKNKNNKKEYNFNIIINQDNKIIPKIFCQSLDIFDNDKKINIIDKRDLFLSIIEKNYNYKNNIMSELLYEIIIKKIPEFVTKLFFYEENKVLVYYGKYYLNEIYNINDFVSNKSLLFYKVMTYKEKDFTQLNIKYIIISDFHILFFDLINEKPKNICKLIFVGEIYKINSFERLEENNINNIIINDENNGINISQNKIYIDWVSNDNEVNKYIFSIIYDNNNKENIPDFIDVINKKQTFIGIKYNLIINDYNEYNNQIDLNELIKLAKFLEKKEKNLGENAIYKKELNKIYQKIIDISTKFNKIEITLEYLDKLKKKKEGNDEEMKNKEINNEKKEQNKIDSLVKLFE